MKTFLFTPHGVKLEFLSGQAAFNYALRHNYTKFCVYMFQIGKISVYDSTETCVNSIQRFENEDQALAYIKFVLF